MERDGEPRLPERLHRPRLAQHPRAARNEHVLPAVGVDRVGDEAVDGGRGGAVEAIREHRVDDRPFQDAVERTRCRDGVGPLRRHALARSPLLLDRGGRCRLSSGRLRGPHCGTCPRRCTHRRIRDLVHGGSRGRIRRAARRRGRSSGIRSVRFGSTTEHDVAGEQALVLAATPVSRDRVFGWRRLGRLVVASRRGRGRLLGGLQLGEGTCLGGAQTLLIVPHPIGALRRS